MSISEIRFKEIAEKSVQKLLELDYYEAMEFFKEDLDLDESEREYLEVPMKVDESERKFTCEDCPYYWTDFDGDIPYCHYGDDDGYAPCTYEEPEEINYEEYI